MKPRNTRNTQKTAPAVCGFFLLFALLFSGCATVADLTKFPDPHHHTIAVHRENSSPHHVRDMEAQNPHKLILRKPDMADAVTNASRTCVAALTTMQHVIYGSDVSVLLIFRHDKEPLCFISHTWPDRAMEGLVWLDDRLLAFDLMAGANLGWHYVIDADDALPVFAAPFMDEQTPSP